MIKNFLITGKPGCGKTSLIKEILKEKKPEAGGFFTEEIRKRGQRVGFKILTLDKKEGILAHQKIKSPYRVSKYKVNLKDLDQIGVESIITALNKGKLIVIDEIGKMELFSEKFKRALVLALDSKNKVLGTIKLTFDPFTEKIKKRKDTKIFYLTKKNRKKIKAAIFKFLAAS